MPIVMKRVLIDYLGHAETIDTNFAIVVWNSCLLLFWEVIIYFYTKIAKFYDIPHNKVNSICM